MMKNWFTRDRKKTISISTDIHSHLLPGIDDGVQTIEEALTVIQAFYDLGFTKLVTTPHIMSDYYKNTPEIIRTKLNEVKLAVANANIPIEIEAAAEYYLDELFYEQINQSEELLTFGDNFVLFETSFTNEPLLLKEVIFKLNTNDFKPVLAHPERYMYLLENKILLNELIDQQLLFQLNVLSFTGYYSKAVQKFAIELMEKDAIAFVGSDCHNLRQAEALKKAYSNKYVQQLASGKLLNYQL